VALVAGDADAFADALADAVAATARALPPPRATTPERAAVRTFVEGAEWRGARAVCVDESGTVLRDDASPLGPTCGRRTIRVQRLDGVERLATLVPSGLVECVGLAGVPAGALWPLRRLGVSRLCAIGRMQRPSLAWPRGQRSPLGALLGARGGPRLQVET